MGGPPDRRPELAALSQRVVRALGRLLELRYAIDARVPPELFRHPSDRRVILAPLHRSLLDPILIARSFDTRQWRNLVPVRALATRSFRWLRPLTPLIRLVYRIAGAVELPPRRGDAAMTPHEKLRGLIAALERGDAVAIFPEGHVREGDGGRVGDYQPGVVHLHRLSGAPIVPIAVRFGAPRWPRRRYIVRVGRPVRLPATLDADGAAAWLRRHTAWLAGG